MAPRPPSGRNRLVAGSVAAALLPALSIGLHMPYRLACVVAGLPLAGILIVFASCWRLDRFRGAGVARSRVEFADDLLSDARGSLTTTAGIGCRFEYGGTL